MKQIILMLFSLLVLPSCSKDDGVKEVEPPAGVERSIRVVVGSEVFNATLYDNATTEAFRAMLPLTVNMREFNGNEKYYDLSGSLPTESVRPATIRNGDIMLYGSQTLVLFYKTFSSSYSYTRIGKINNASGLKAALGTGNVTIKFELE